MTKPLLTKDIAYKAIQDFFIENPKPMVIFGTGTSCALDPVFGMPALRDKLVAEFQTVSFNRRMKEEWDSVVAALNAGQDLENAMNLVSDSGLLDQIVTITADFIIESNRRHAYPILSGDAEWPADAIFRSLVSGLPETNRCLHVATTNYDMLAECSFSRWKIPYLTGFRGGICRWFDPERAERTVVYMADSPARNKLQRKKKLEKHIRLYKVHGSINTFELKDSLVENDEWISYVPPGVKRRMITPGMEKNIKIHERRRELIGGFDQAVFQHNAFLFLGFGFNDDPIVNDTLRQKCTAQGAPGLIITKDRNLRIDQLLAGSERLWLVCKNPEGAGALITNSQYNANVIIPDRELWKFKIFATEFFGG
jgi:hypothetical protein